MTNGRLFLMLLLYGQWLCGMNNKKYVFNHNLMKPNYIDDKIEEQEVEGRKKIQHTHGNYYTPACFLLLETTTNGIDDEIICIKAFCDTCKKSMQEQIGVQLITRLIKKYGLML